MNSRMIMFLLMLSLIVFGCATGVFSIKAKNGKKFEILIAKRKVIEVSNSTCRVEVINYSSANVMENHFARLSPDQSITMAEKFRNPTLFFKKKNTDTHRNRLLLPV